MSSGATTGANSSSRGGNTHLTPGFCLNERALRDFLRTSRQTLDDTIILHLNALSTPSTTSPLPPLPVSISPHRPTTASSTGGIPRTLPTSTCRAFLDQALFPSWKGRDDVFEYCSTVAKVPDPDSLQSVNLETSSTTSITPAALYSGTVSPRLDPYSARTTPTNPSQLQTNDQQRSRLQDTLSYEQSVEKLVRRRVWDVVTNRCEGGTTSATFVNNFNNNFPTNNTGFPGDGLTENNNGTVPINGRTSGDINNSRGGYSDEDNGWRQGYHAWRRQHDPR